MLLDEPLANLDYKLREELRAELPRIFEASGAIFVYATTEPSEALLLGGSTICMWEGQALQIGETAQGLPPSGYGAGGRVFSDPPLNDGHREKTGNEIALRQRRPGAGERPLCCALATAPYRVGFRAHQLGGGQPA